MGVRLGVALLGEVPSAIMIAPSKGARSFGQAKWQGSRSGQRCKIVVRALTLPATPNPFTRSAQATADAAPPSAAALRLWNSATPRNPLHRRSLETGIARA